MGSKRGENKLGKDIRNAYNNKKMINIKNISELLQIDF